jgi:hypothetical protein
MMSRECSSLRGSLPGRHLLSRRSDEVFSRWCFFGILDLILKALCLGVRQGASETTALHPALTRRFSRGELSLRALDRLSKRLDVLGGPPTRRKLADDGGAPRPRTSENTPSRQLGA